MKRLGFLLRIVFGLWFCLAILRPVTALRPLRERARSWGDEVSVKLINSSFVCAQSWCNFAVWSIFFMLI